MRKSFLAYIAYSYLWMHPALRRKGVASLFLHRTSPTGASGVPRRLGVLGVEYSYGCTENSSSLPHDRVMNHESSQNGSMDQYHATHCSGQTSNSSTTSKSKPLSYQKSHHACLYNRNVKQGTAHEDNENFKTTEENGKTSFSSAAFEKKEEGCRNEADYGTERSTGHESGTADSRERRSMAKKWENTFFGRKQYEKGMRERFHEAIKAEMQEKPYHKLHRELFPGWFEDEETPLEKFRTLAPSLQLRHIINRLTMGERRIRYAVDYGSLSMMQQLNLGEFMIRDAEKLLSELDWFNEEVRERIDELKAIAVKIKYDYDLD